MELKIDAQASCRRLSFKEIDAILAEDEREAFAQLAGLSKRSADLQWIYFAATALLAAVMLILAIW